jgi:hypothetical protein
MSAGVPERRRSPRVDLESGWLSTPATWGVELLDLSLGGLSCSSPYALGVGRTVWVRTMLGGAAFTAQVRVCWSRPRRGPRSQFDLGVAFLPLEESSRRALESFLRVSPPR